MKLLLQFIWLLAATAIPLTTKDLVCEDLQKKLGEMAYRAHDFYNDNCATDHCHAVNDEARAIRFGEAQALAVQIHDIGCKPEVDAAAQIQRRDAQPQYSSCEYFHSQLVTLNQAFDTMLNNPSHEDDPLDASNCAVAQKSLPEIDIWSNKCASSTPTIGRETVNLVNSLHRLGCVWNSTCGGRCFQIGDSMFLVARNMGPLACNHYDPTGGPHEMDIERLTL